MTVYKIDNSAALKTLTSTLKFGDKVLLAPGQYANVSLSGKNLAGVTIASADLKAKAVLNDLTLKNISGLTIQDVELSTVSGSKRAFALHDVADVHLDRLIIHGSENPEDWSITPSLLIRNSRGVTITNSEFFHLEAGLSLLDTKGVSVTGNFFHDLRSDGVHGGGNSQLLISKNAFKDFFPKPGDHPDAIQLWTANTTNSARDITISDNVIMRGDGVPTQGIFLKDEKGDLPYSNVTISGNLVVGESYRAISVSHADGLNIHGNTVLAFADRKSWISADGSTKVSVHDNVSQSYGVAGWNLPGNRNKLSDLVSDGGLNALTSWVAAHGRFDGAWGNAQALASDFGWTMRSTDTSFQPQVLELLGTGGTDYLKAEDGDKTRLKGLGGDDYLHGSAKYGSELIGGEGNDSYNVYGSGDLVIERIGQGRDGVVSVIDYSLPDNVEDLVLRGSGLIGNGNALANKITGTSGNDRLHGWAGNDQLNGEGGADSIWGGDGDDTLRGGNGDDVLFGDAGKDLLLGGNGNDKLDGGGGNDLLRGENGDDYLYGKDGNDDLKGGNGRDTLDGGSGNDVLIGGRGSDVLIGGAGRDVFRFYTDDLSDGSCDTIIDFHRGDDHIDLRQLDANTHTPMNDAFHFVGENPFSGVSGELRFEVTAGGCQIYGDTNGDGLADIMIVMQHVSVLSSGDFYL